MSIPCLISLVIYLLASACLCSQHGFQCMIMIRFYRYTCAYLGTPSGIRITTRWGSSDSSGFSCPGLEALTERGSSCCGLSSLLRSGQTSCSSSPIPAPLVGSQHLLPSRERPFVLYILVHLFEFSHLRLSVM